MEKNFRELRVYARSNFSTFIVITVNVASSVADLTQLIYFAVGKVSSFDSDSEKFKVEHIEITKLNSYGKSKENNFEVYP